MANNIVIRDGADDIRVMATTEIDGVHYINHIALAEGSLFDEVTLAANLTGGSSTPIEIGFGEVDGRPGLYQFTAWGTPAESLLKLQFSPDAGVTWIDTDITHIADNVIYGVHLAKGRYRVTVDDEGTATLWNADLRGIG
jgi:hypothetical protein